jgi:hypothetical protein
MGERSETVTSTGRRLRRDWVVALSLAEAAARVVDPTLEG